jgi:hypothetical protein
MDFNQAQIDLLLWITGFVEQPNAQLQGWPPCPYARRARLSGEFEIRQGRVDPYLDLQQVNMNEKTVVAYVYDPQHFQGEEFNRLVDQVNQDFLVSRDLLALADHPDSLEIVKGVKLNQGTWAVVFVQPLTKLNEFAKMLAGQGYYKDWPEDYLQGLFAHREDPRT